MSAPRRVAFDARYVNDRYHGIGRYGFRLLEALAAAAPHITFIVFRGPEPDSRFPWHSLAARPNVNIRPSPRPLYWPQEQVWWPWLLRQAQADLYHSPHFVAPLLAPCPVVVTVHDLIFDRYPAAMPQAWARPYYRWLMQQSTRRAQRVITTTHATAGDLAYLYWIPSPKICVIPAGVEPAFQPLLANGRSQETRQRYGLERPFVLAVGARRPHKNLGRLVHAYARVSSQVPHDLVLAGPADDRFPDEARQAAEEAQLNGRVRFLDWVPEADLATLYTLADLVAMPSLIEGFGLPALEAMSCGTPVLASNSSSLPEVVGQAGRLVDPTDVNALAEALQQLLSDERLRRKLGQAGRQRAAAFSWSQIARQTLRLYDEIVA
ncbi:MAG: glycosyltransferase family 4 protein [Chloroflexi bacterium]|nr:glycosyltransferase family 4 protein [Chloroflexota bacterium]